MSALYITGYFVCGMLGGYLLWLDWVRHFEQYRCPTPRAILGMLAVSILGPIPLAVGSVVLCANWLENNFRWGKWWKSPVCRKNKS